MQSRLNHRSLWICALYVATLGAGSNLEQPAELGATDRWPNEYRAGPFYFHADFSLAEHDHLVLETVNLQQDLARLLGIRASDEQIHMFLFSRKRVYQDYIQHYFPQVPYRRALFIKRRGPGMVFAYRSRDFDIDVRHESTHALLHASLTHVPLWLDEGLAEYFEVPPRERAQQNPHLAASRHWLAWGGIPHIESLEQIKTLDQMGPKQYQQAWSWVHFMLHGPAEAHDELVRYLADLQASVPAGQLSSRLRHRLGNLQQQYIDHFRNWQP